MSNYEISPSILTVKKEDLANALKITENQGIKYLHFDVMDGKFVPNTSYNASDLKEISKLHHMINDVHLMIEKPINYIKDYIVSGADIITFHFEACSNNDEVIDTIKLIKSFNKKVGISIKPQTNPNVIDEFIKDIDLVLIMTVEPGKGGQSFMNDCVYKIKYFKDLKDKYNLKDLLIEVDGGINDVTIKECVNNGANLIVAGSYIYNKEDIKTQINKLKGANNA